MKVRQENEMSEAEGENMRRIRAEALRRWLTITLAASRSRGEIARH